MKYVQCFFSIIFVEYETNGCLDNSTEEDVDADSWEQVGPKKKSVLTRKVTSLLVDSCFSELAL